MPAEGEGPGSAHVGCAGICAALAWLILLAVLDLYFLAVIWPHPTPSGLPSVENTATQTDTAQTQKPATTTSSGPTIVCLDCNKVSGDAKEECDCWHRVAAMQGAVCKDGQAPKLGSDPSCVYLLGFGWKMMWGETRLLLIVMLSGFLGSLIYSLRSLFWYTGNRALVWSWIPMTTLIPIVGSMIAVVFYLVLRGGLFSPNTSVADTSPFGFAAMSALVGMFINETVLKLKAIFETIMTKKEQGTNTVTPIARPTITTITPASVPADADVTIKVTGDKFTKDSKAYAGSTALSTTFVSDKELDVQITKELIPKANATLPISVQTPGGGASSEITLTVT